jgi:hypothetical protein
MWLACTSHVFKACITCKSSMIKGCSVLDVISDPPVVASRSAFRAIVKSRMTLARDEAGKRVADILDGK